MEGVKTYKAILLGVLGLIIVVAASYVFMKHQPLKKETGTVSHMQELSGQVIRMYEGENKIVYTMDVPQTATATRSMDDALVTVDDNGMLYAAIYFSYEGGRGYSAADYMNQNIVPHVPVLEFTGTTTIGGVVWTTAESANSEWHVGQVGNGAWLMVVESKKVNHDKVVESLESLSTK
jgi:hypothetical protein